ncbi:hypothetical protein MS3_00000691 [Schistosoma haematobium]|uniref:Uncharacterized protein n=1 Tax=Schistosoma haematobium TaxID=6185 RepID=A0A922LEV8_SCHHA|nr:hypothetical protein MS3_00000691 [Schistosoma haematobium]KAH9580485.1 hypothetical protein MS3_00000691 [Schistosoma haematobium]
MLFLSLSLLKPTGTKKFTHLKIYVCLKEHTVVNKNTSEDQMYLNTKLQNISPKSENHTVNTSFTQCQSIVSNLTVPFANISPSSQISLFLLFHTNFIPFSFFSLVLY